MQALMDVVKKPQHSLSVDLTTILMAKAKRMTEMMQQVTIPFLSLCHSDLKDQDVTLF